MAAMVINFVAVASVVFLLAGRVAQMGSAWANVMFLMQQLNTTQMPRFIQLLVSKIGFTNADTAALTRNTAAQRVNAAASSAVTTALVAQRAAAIAAAAATAVATLGISAAVAAAIFSLVSLGNLLVNIVQKNAYESRDAWDNLWIGIGRGDPIIAGTTVGIVALGNALIGVENAIFAVTSGGAKLWSALTGMELPSWVTDWQAAIDEQYKNVNETVDLIVSGMNNQGEAAIAAAEDTRTWGETLDEAGRSAAIAAGEGVLLGESISDISDASLSAQKSMATLVSTVSNAASSYSNLGAVIGRTELDRERGLGGPAAGGGGNTGKATKSALGTILGEWRGSNKEASEFQQRLAEIAQSGSVALAQALADAGVEQAGGIAKALVGNEELQRQFQVQARISGLLANTAFTQGFLNGSDQGISDQTAIEMLGLSDMNTVFAAVEASSYGAGSKQWKEFVRGWNEANSSRPLTTDSFEFRFNDAAGEAAANHVLEQARTILSIGAGVNPVEIPVGLSLDPLFGAGNAGTPGQAGALSYLTGVLQRQIDNQEIDVPAALDTIALTDGYDGWQDMVEKNPTLAKIDVTDKNLLQITQEIQAAINGQTYTAWIRAQLLQPGATGRPERSSGSGGGGGSGGGAYRGGWIDGNGVGHFAGGGGWGLVGGRGTGTSDSNLSWLSKGEYVHPAAATSHYGVGMMDAIRARQFPTVDQFASMLKAAMVSGNSGPQSVTNVQVTQNYPQTVNPLDRLREESENLVAGIWR